MRKWNLFTGLLGARFWQLYRKDGFMRTYLRGRVGFFTSLQKAGYGQNAAPEVGRDEYGNLYYEEMDYECRVLTRLHASQMG